MALSVNSDDVKKEVQQQTNNATVKVGNSNEGKTVIVTIDTPEAVFRINRDSIVQAIGGSVPDFAGAVTSGNYQKVIDLIRKNLPAITGTLLGFDDSDKLSPKFDVRQSEDGKKCYSCRLEHILTVKRNPVSLFDLLLADGGIMQFFTGRRPIASETIPRNASNRTVTLSSEVVLETDQKDLPYFSSAVFGVQLQSITEQQGIGNTLAALTRLLVQNLEAEVTIDNTVVQIRELDPAECATMKQRFAFLDYAESLYDQLAAFQPYGATMMSPTRIADTDRLELPQPDRTILIPADDRRIPVPNPRDPVAIAGRPLL